MIIRNKAMERFWRAMHLVVIITMVAPMITIAPQTSAVAPVPGSIQILNINGDTAPFEYSCPDNPPANPVTITGSGAGSAPPGQIEQYAVQVDWGDGNQTNGLGTFTPNSGQGNFTFTYSGGPYEYATSGSYTITARLYHTQPPGNDGQADTVASIDVCITIDEEPEPTFCGDGVIQTPNDDQVVEQCDGQAGFGPHQSCDAQTCQLVNHTYCGDGITQAPNDEQVVEQCDAGPNGSESCSVTCETLVVPVCGDGVKEGQEQCDDSNLLDGDGCSANCSLEQVSCEETTGSDEGWYGRYYNYSRNHPDMNLQMETWPDDGHGDPLGSWDTDWYDNTYFKFSRIDSSLTFGEDFFPFDIAPDEIDDGHEFHFGVHWSGLVHVSTSSDYLFEIVNDDDAWVYVDGTLVLSSAGIHVPTTTQGMVSLSGTHVVDIFFAERHVERSHFSFNWLSEDVAVEPYNPDCPECGNYHREGEEQCDHGPNGSLTCSVECTTIIPVECGDGIKAGQEQCDDANDVNGDGCNNACELEQLTCEDFPTEENGWYGRYFNYPKSHTDMDVGMEYWPDDGHGDPLGSWDTDWYDNTYFKFSRIDSSLTFGEDFFPFDIAPDELDFFHEFHFGVHWSGLASTTIPGLYDIQVTSDDDVWVYLDGTLVFDMPGVHEPQTEIVSLNLTGINVIDVYFAERHAVRSHFSMDWLSDGVTVDPYNPDCPECGNYIVEESSEEECDAGPNGSEECSVQCENLVETRICGYKWHDIDGGGYLNNQEPKLSNWTIDLLEFNEGWNVATSTVTDEDGNYCFDDLNPGEYRVEEQMQGGWASTTPSFFDVFVELGETEEVNFGNKYSTEVEPGSICGYKFHDLNQNGVFDENENGIPNWTIFATGNSTTTTNTNQDGLYCFAALTEGIWNIFEEIVPGWATTTNATTTINFTGSGIGNINFGNFMCVDSDEDGYDVGGGLCGPVDCQDNNSSVNPGATEVCNEIDDDCDGQTDEGNVCDDNEEPPSITTTSTGGGGGGGGGGNPQFLTIHTMASLSSCEPTVSVTVTWFTNQASDSRVVYDTVSHAVVGSSPTYGYAASTATTDEGAGVTFHSVVIGGLNVGTTYYFRPISELSGTETYGDEGITTVSCPSGPDAGPEGPGGPGAGSGGEVLGVDNGTGGPEDQPGGQGGGTGGTVAGVEFAEAVEGISTTTPNIPAGGETADAGTEEGQAPYDCSLYLWILFILNAFAIAWLWMKGKGATNTWLHNGWWIIGLIALLAIIIWYPACWLVVVLIITLVAELVTPFVIKNES